MAGYQPIYIKGNATGLVQDRIDFILPEDAYPTLQNAFVWRERLKRKQGCKLLARLTRDIIDLSIGTTTATTFSFNLFSLGGITEPNAQLQPGNVQIYFSSVTYTGNVIAPGYSIATDCEVFSNTITGLFNGSNVTISGVQVNSGTGINAINNTWLNVEVIPANTSFKIKTDSHSWATWKSGGTWTSDSGSTNVFVDDGNGNLVAQNNPLTNFGTVNYATGQVTITHTAGAGVAASASFGYYPSLPVMGLCSYERSSTYEQQLIAFDTKYAYFFPTSNSSEEFIPGTTWSGTDYNFFWSTNYWTDPANQALKLFWVTNYSGKNGDPIRYTNGTAWFNFGASATPNKTGRIDVSGNYLNQCLCLVPFRGRLIAFNTLEGTTLGNSVTYLQRIRWAAIGNPLIVDALDGGTAGINGPWRDDVRGRGGFIDIPTTESIISVGFVRDNLVIFCEHSTWQLRYTGRSIAPFQLEKVNTELGCASTFSSVQFDTSLVGIGDKGITECDSFKADRIDVKITDFVYQINVLNEGSSRVHGVRDFRNRLAYWTYPSSLNQANYPDRRLVYNYENDSWAIFIDSFTTLGKYQAQDSRTWEEAHVTWETQNITWSARPAAFLDIVGGNQQGFVEILDIQTVNDVSLQITAITGNVTTPTVITSPSHNLFNNSDNQSLPPVITISGIPVGSSYANLNGGVFGIFVLDGDTFQLFTYNPSEDAFNTPQLDASGTYIGGGLIAVLDNFRILSKKFNAMDEAQKIQLGYIDALFNWTEAGAVTLKVYNDYENENPTNIPTLDENGDSFFNTVVPTSPSTFDFPNADKNLVRTFCPTRANFIQFEWCLSNAQMNGVEQASEVEIQMQVVWMRKAGRIGFN